MDWIDWTLIGFIAANAAAAFSGSYFQPGAWYERLRKPAWNPPKWLFPVAWTILYAMVAAAGYLAHEAGGGVAGAPAAMALYALQLVLNAGWSAVFFGMRRPDLALYEVAALWLSILATTIAFFQISSLAGWLMVPYLLWVSFAARLNHKIWRLNPETARGGAA